MERYLVGAGLFAVAGALWFRSFVPLAYAEGTRFSKCAVVETAWVTNGQSPDDPKFAAKLVTVPEGWTPIGGGLAPPGYGATVMCR